MTDVGTMCAFHHATPSVDTCAVCTKLICKVCAKTLNSRVYCAGCSIDRAQQLPWLAAIFSLVVPGAGQVYNGDWGKAVLFLFTAPLVIPWIWCVYDATAVAAQIAAGRRDATTVPTGFVLIGLKVLIIPVAIGYVILVITVVGAIASALAMAN